MPSRAAHSAAPAGPAGERLNPGPAHAAQPGRGWRRLRPEHGLVLVLGLLVLAVHDVGYLLRQPYWNDEAWVAVTTRFPLSALPATTSSTPIGWSFLARLLTFGHSQSARLLPLAFAGAAVMIGYWLARRLEWPGRGTGVAAGVLAAAAVLLVPAMLVRDDLKQYTADACIALLILAATARLERQWSRAGLVLLSVSVWGGMLLSHTAAFTGAAALGALGLVQLVRRDWRRLAEAVLAGLASAALGLAVYEAFDARAELPGLTAYWRDYFVPRHGGLHAAVSFVIRHFELIHRYFGLGPSWLAVPLVLAGLITTARLGRPATALAVVALWPEMLALSALRKYPLLDLRTSTFLIAVTAVVAAIGVAGICAALRARLRDGTVGTAAAAVIAVVALAAFGLGARPYVRSHHIRYEDIRQQTQSVARLAGPRDPIVVSSNSNWGFAYYWADGQPGRRPSSANLQGYQAYFPGQPRIIVAANRDVIAISAAMSQALRQARRLSCSRIWLVRTHVDTVEHAAWITVLHRLRLTPTVLPDGAAWMQPGPRSCR
jgi:hypothetical protein